MDERPVAGTSEKLGTHAARLSALFEAHADRLYRLARRLVSNADDALDLIQETFLKAARSPESIPRGVKNEEAWLVRVLINIRRDQWRRDRVRNRYQLDQSHASVQHVDPEKAFLLRTTVWRALDCLSPRRRAIVVMHEIEGLSTSAIASLLRINTITVRWHLSKGRRELAQRLRLQLGEADGQSQESLAGRRPAPSRSPAP